MMLNNRYVVITPVRNEESNLPRTIESVCAQTVRPKLWIIVDDGSTDRTALIADASAKDHPWILVFGLVLSVVLMGIAANFIARYIERYRWIAYIGLAVIIWVAGKMIWEGFHDVAPLLA